MLIQRTAVIGNTNPLRFIPNPDVCVSLISSLCTYLDSCVVFQFNFLCTELICFPILVTINSLGILRMTRGFGYLRD